MQLFRSNKQKRRGQALMEFALVLPVLLILTMLIIQYGIIFYTTIGLTNLSREGARFAATQPTSDAPIIQRMEDVVPPSINWNDVKDGVTISPNEGNADRNKGSNELITVEITYDMDNKLFLPSTFLGVQVFSETYTTQTTMMVE